MKSNEHVWVVILAAGEGKRVSDLTRDRWGNPAPKQFSSIDGRSTLLATTLERAKKIAPVERIVPIVAPQHQCWWARELVEIPSGNVIVQPENRGTAAGILLPLLRVTRHDPGAVLVILPSDHGVTSEATLNSAIIDATVSAGRSGAGLVLLGVRPGRPETGYGWIVPRPGESGRLQPISSFCEKPDAVTTASLFDGGALLNSFITVARGQFLLNLFETVLPQLWRAFQPVLSHQSDILRNGGDVTQMYRSIPSLDFSKDLLEHAAEKLWVYPVPACGWLDLGTPARLAGHLIEHRRGTGGGSTQTVARGLGQATRHVTAKRLELCETVETSTRVSAHIGA